MIQGTVYNMDSARVPIQNPFILVGHHTDDYPKGNGKMAPEIFPEDWQKGHDFNSERGWKMYHGEYVPGFPAHPHRGFETITYAKKGLIDHFDSQGNYGRYGNGDIQWMISGDGLQHAEMFPLVNTQENNPFEIVQIWLNLPAHMKRVTPSYQMHWQEELPSVILDEAQPTKNYLKILVGHFENSHAKVPAKQSYGYDPDHAINVWDGKIQKGNSVRLPQFPEDVKVQVYVIKGKLRVEAYEVNAPALFVYTADEAQTFYAEADTEFMVFTGKEIKEEVVAYGPFVMNTRAEVLQAYQDFEATEFGGWPWESSAPTIAPEKGRFSVHDHGTKEQFPPTN